MSGYQATLFPENEFAASALNNKDPISKETTRRAPKKKITDDQLEFFDLNDKEAVMERMARKAHMAWLKRSLREFPRLNEKIERLEKLAVGVVEEKTPPQKPSLPSLTPTSKNPHRVLLSDEERHIAEIILAITPEAFRKKPTGLLTSGRFHQQVRTMFQKQPDLQPLISQLIDYSRDRPHTNSPVEMKVFRHENSRERALEMAKQLRKKKAVFDEALGQMEKYQPDSYQMLKLRFIQRFSAIKVQMYLEMESESTYAAYLREALHWLSLYVKNAQEHLG